jgi:multiple antibiotic resistance protein
MALSNMYAEILMSFITLFIIIDPFMSVLFFISEFKNKSIKEKNKAILTAIIVAAVLLVVFLYTGLYILNALKISFSGLRIAGGLILLVMGITTVLGIELGGKREKVTSAAILIGTPLLSGPGALTTIIILSKDYGYTIPLIAALLVILVSYIMLKGSFLFEKIFGKDVILIFSKVLGLLLAALAVDFIYLGVKDFILLG